MKIGEKVMQIEDGKAYRGVLLATRKRGDTTEGQVRWHRGSSSWVPMVMLDSDEELPA